MGSVMAHIQLGGVDDKRPPREGDLVEIHYPKLRGTLGASGNIQLKQTPTPRPEVKIRHARSGFGWADGNPRLESSEIFFGGWKAAQKDHYSAERGPADYCAVDLSGNERSAIPGALQVGVSDVNGSDITATFPITLPYLRAGLERGQTALVVCKAGEKRSVVTVAGLKIWGVRAIHSSCARRWKTSGRCRTRRCSRRTSGGSRAEFNGFRWRRKFARFGRIHLMGTRGISRTCRG